MFQRIRVYRAVIFLFRSAQKKPTNLVEDLVRLLSLKFLSNSVQWLQRRNRKRLIQSEALVVIFIAHEPKAR